MTDNYSVVHSWVRGYSADNGRATLHTDGNNLYSYRLRIGYTESNGDKVVFLYNAPNENFKSATTSKHVALASRQADETVSPSDDS